MCSFFFWFSCAQQHFVAIVVTMMVLGHGSLAYDAIYNGKDLTRSSFLMCALLTLFLPMHKSLDTSKQLQKVNLCTQIFYLLI